MMGDFPRERQQNGQPDLMKVLKSHGLGNDYLIIENIPSPPSPLQVVLLCDRNHGVGGDGLLLRVPGDHADFGLRIYNPDGSLAEISGNGLRIFAHWLHHHQGAPERFTVATGGRVVPCWVQGDRVTVEMGRASFDPAEVPVRADRPFVDAPLPPEIAGADGPTLRATAVGLGNPHCVIFVDQDPGGLPWRRWGAALERHALFPNRTNVQFAQVLAPDHIRIRIHERGAGPTLASGSSACGVAAAALRTGRAGPHVRIEAPGGVLSVSIDERWMLRLEGPVEEVGVFHPSPALQRRWRAAGAPLQSDGSETT
jgi:diaminopimelate epimerase